MMINLKVTEATFCCLSTMINARSQSLVMCNVSCNLVHQCLDWQAIYMLVYRDHITHTHTHTNTTAANHFADCFTVHIAASYAKAQFTSHELN